MKSKLVKLGWDEKERKLSGDISTLMEIRGNSADYASGPVLSFQDGVAFFHGVKNATTARLKRKTGGISGQMYLKRPGVRFDVERVELDGVGWGKIYVVTCEVVKARLPGPLRDHSDKTRFLQLGFLPGIDARIFAWRMGTSDLKLAKRFQSLLADMGGVSDLADFEHELAFPAEWGDFEVPQDPVEYITPFPVTGDDWRGSWFAAGFNGHGSVDEWRTKLGWEGRNALAATYELHGLFFGPGLSAGIHGLGLFKSPE